MQHSHICLAALKLKSLFACADYLTKVVVKGKSSTSVHVQDVMTPASRLMTVTPNHSVLEVMSMMNDNNFRHVPVVSLCTFACQCQHTVICLLITSRAV